MEQLQGKQLAKTIVEALSEYELHSSSAARRPKIADFLKYEPIESDCKPLCAKTIAVNQQVAECLDCGLCPNSIICLGCFAKSNHEGHRFKIIKANGGSCDCGDAQVWKPSGFCLNHTGAVEDVQIPQIKMDQFVLVWGELFRLMFDKNCPIKGDSKVAAALAKAYCDFLRELAGTGLYYCKLITGLFASKITIVDANTGHSRCLSIIDSILTCILKSEIAGQYVQLIISISPDKASKELLFWSYLANYEQIARDDSDGYLALGCQLFTHEDLIALMIEKGIFLTMKDTSDYHEPYEKASRHLYNLGYLTHLQETGKKYWRSYFSRGGSLVELCSFWRYNELSWTDQHSYTSELRFYTIEKHLLTLVAKACVALDDHELLQGAAVQLLRFVSANLKVVRNRCYLSLHRMLSLVLFVLADGRLKRVAALAWLKTELPAEVAYTLLRPVLECIWLNNKLLQQVNLRFHYQLFTKRYAEGTERIFAYDAFLIKALVLSAPEAMDITAILPAEVRRFLSSCQEEAPTIVEVDSEKEEELVQDIYALANMMACFCLLAVSDCEELNLREDVLRGQVECEENIAEDVIASYLSRVRQSSIENIKKLSAVLLHQNQGFVMRAVKEVAVFDRNTRQFVPKERREAVNFNYFYDRVQLTKLLQAEHAQPNYELSVAPNPCNQSVFCTIVSHKLIQHIDGAFKSLSLKVKGSKQLGAFSYLWVQLCKVYEVGSKCPGFSLLPLVGQVIARNQVTALVTPDSLACWPSSLAKQHSPAAMSPAKRDVKEIQRLRMEQIRNKQKAFSLKMAQFEAEPEQATEAAGSHCCCICKGELKSSQTAYPIGIQFSNLSGLRRTQASKKGSYFSNNFLENEAVIETSGGLVLNSCNHEFHLDCLQASGHITACSICKRKASGYLVKQDATLPKKVAADVLRSLWRAANPRVWPGSAQFCGNMVKLVADCLVESVGYQATFELDMFMKTKLHLYRDLVWAARVYISSLEEVDQASLQQELKQQIHKECNALKRVVYCYFHELSAVSHASFNYFCDSAANELLPADAAEFQLQREVLGYLFGFQSLPSFKEYALSLPQPKEHRGFQFRELPSEYTPLHSFRRSCPKCGTLNTKICICLMCNWMGCSGCTKGGSLSEHASVYHANVSLFLWLELGKFLVIAQPKATLAGIAYKNEFGQGVNVMNKELEQFKLDSELYLRVQRIIVEGEASDYIEQNHIMGKETFNSANM